MERPDTESFLDANSRSFSSYHHSDFQPDPSRAFTPPSSTTTVDENIIARTHDVASTIPHINCSHKRQKNYMVDLYDETMGAAFNRDYELYARTSHMGILDPTYKIFTSQDGYGSLIYKIQDGTVIVTGDPLCSDQCREPLLNELRRFRWARGLSLAFVGVSEDFAMYAQNQGWMTMSFGHERVLNPLTNKVLRKEAGKRVLSQNKQLLDRKRGGVSIHLYNPSMTEIDLDLEKKLQDLYDDWRSHKNRENEGASRAFVTVYDLFSYPQSTMFLYTTDSKCNVNGFAALRSLGTQPGYHIDPCIASQDAPRGITDLLIITAMQLLQSAGIGFLSLGFEPIDDLQEIKGQTNLQSRLWRRGYKHTIKSVPVVGKAAYFKKFHPDESLGSKLFICLPTKGIPLRSSIALLHFANMSVRQLFTQAKPIQQHE